METSNNDKLVTKKGNVMSVADYKSWERKKIEEQKAKTMKLHAAIRKNYWDYMYDGVKHEDAVKLLKSECGYHGKSVNIAVNGGKLTGPAKVEFATKALVLQEREEKALDDEIEHIDSLIAEAYGEGIDQTFSIKGKSGARGVDDIEWLPRDEYIMRLNQRKRKAIKDTVDSLKVFKDDKSDVNVIITAEDHAARMKDGAGKFGIEIKADYKVEESD